MARILLIDDDDGFRTMLCRTLAHHGHTVIEARDGNEGLKLLRDAGADLLIADIVMPEKDGLEVLMELRRKKSAVKIIAVSGAGSQSAADYLHIAKHLGAAKVLVKPFSSEVLVATINGLLAAGRAAAPEAALRAARG